VTTIRFPDEVAVSGDALTAIAATLGIPVAQLRVGCDGDTTGGSSYDLRAGGWLYERPDDEQIPGDRVLAPGIIGFPAGSRWTGGGR
jgi:hypothetical protein